MITDSVTVQKGRYFLYAIARFTGASNCKDVAAEISCQSGMWFYTNIIVPSFWEGYQCMIYPVLQVINSETTYTFGASYHLSSGQPLSSYKPYVEVGFIKIR